MKEAGTSVLIFDKIDFKALVRKNEEGPFRMIKGTLYKKDITILNTDA